jgi:hypothetical protein
MRRFLFAAVLLLASVSVARADEFRIFRAGGSAASYPDILFYWSMEGTTADKSAGDTSPTYNGACARDNSGTPTQPLGSYILQRAGAGSYERAVFTIDNTAEDIIKTQSGRIGFWWYNGDNTWSANNELFAVVGTGGSIRAYTETTNTRIRFQYISPGGTIVANASNLSINTWYFLQFRWDSTAGSIGVFVDGAAEVATAGAISAWTAKPTTFAIGDGAMGSTHKADWDQFIVSSSYTRDLYAVRANTSFPN